MGASRPAIPDVIDRFRAYRDDHPEWGALHVVLGDGNTQDGFVDEEAEQLARDDGDEEGAQLIVILRQMSRTQRRKLSRVI